MARDPGLNTRTMSASGGAVAVAVPRPWDNLAAPSNDDLIGSAVSLWPPGPAFGSPDGQALSLTSKLALFTRVLISPWERLYARAFKLLGESTIYGVDEMLPDWEIEYGLPDPCGYDDESIAGRLRALEAKLMSVASVTPGDFIRLAASYGFTITIEEPAVFECGFSECGGEHTVGDARQETYWVVHIENLAVDYFTCGESECGYDPLFSLGGSERLLCLLRQNAPAWTLPVPGLSGGFPYILTYFDDEAVGYISIADDGDETVILVAD
ncbi:putative phage tail protein [Agrobacterium pusense]|uniref:putative phage tail protein n=1 Tax=Agrobacterium pusense TaxID=648995 RepID=UPI001300BCC4|nr:putative phage tail protein [Agrobacterium pusense]